MMEQSKNNKIIEKGLLAADRIIAMQKNDGSIISIIKTSGVMVEQAGWARSILAAWALAEFGRFVDDEKYTLGAQKAFEYYDWGLLQGKHNTTPFNWVFMGQLSIALKKNEKALEYAQKILENINPYDYKKMDTFDCSLISYIASFLIAVSSLDKKYLELALTMAEWGKAIFETNITDKINQSHELTLYAELPITFLLLFDTTGEKKYLDFSKKVTAWILESQLEDGSFRVISNKNVANSGASSRILETIALFANHPKFTTEQKNIYRQPARKALRWILSMQYDGKNIYYIKSCHYSMMTGGFRRTYSNSEVRIDSIAHFLLAITRLDPPNNPDAVISCGGLPQIHYPLIDPKMPFSEDNTSKISTLKNGRLKLFFGSSFQFEMIFNKYIRKIFSHFPLFSKSRLETMFGHTNDILRNYSYVIELLKEKKILKNVTLENCLVKTAFKEAPSFYETFLRSDCPRTKNSRSEEKSCFGRGFSENWETCLGKALGEFLERYFHFFPKSKNQLIRASEKELAQKKRKHIPIASLAVFPEEQKNTFPKKKWDGNSKFYWEKCHRYSTGKEILAPAQLIYWGYKNAAGEPVLREKNTNGLGGFFSQEGAILSGLYEVIQRDAFFCHWMNKITPFRIDISSMKDATFQKCYGNAQGDGFEIASFYLPSDTRVPVIITIIKDESGGPYYSLGAGCDLDIASAVKRSAEEAWSVYYYVAKMDDGDKKNIAFTNHEPFTAPLDNNGRLFLWSNPEMKGKLDFFMSGKVISFESISIELAKKFKTEKEELDYVVRNVEKLGRGYEVYVHLARHKTLRQVGYSSARVIVPQFLPLYSHEKNAPLDHPRLKGKDINTLPHPFP